MTPTPRIDAHHHFWNPSSFHYPWMEGAALDPVRRPFEPGDLQPELTRNHIDGTVLVQTVSDVAETAAFLRTARDVPFVKGVVGWVDLTSPAVGDQLDALTDEHGRLLVGIRHQVHDEADAAWLLRADVRRGLRAISDRGLRYDLLVRARELPAATETVGAFPELGFVLDHIAKPHIASGRDAEWAERIGALAALPNVTVKLSGMVTEADWTSWSSETLHPYVERVLELFGPSRAMFGSDWPVCLLAADGYGSVLDALTDNLRLLSPTEREAVLGGTAAAFYRLDV